MVEYKLHHVLNKMAHAQFEDIIFHKRKMFNVDFWFYEHLIVSRQNLLPPNISA